MPSCNRTDTADAERESAQTSARSLVTRELDQAAEEAELNRPGKPGDSDVRLRRTRWNPERSQSKPGT